MKAILLFTITLFNFISFSQTKLDSLILDEVNHVRDSIGVTHLTFSKDLFLISERNTLDIIKTNKVGHSNDFISAEIVNFVPTKVIKDNDSLRNIAKGVVNSWRKSSEHWEILIDGRWKLMGGSSVAVGQSYFCGKGMKYFDVYTTVNFK
jgi:uncharacterized protein YkwD